jgi:hypothetical protein
VDTIELHSKLTADVNYNPVTGGKETIDPSPAAV